MTAEADVAVPATGSLTGRLDELCALHGVPGAALGLLVDGAVTTTTSGVTKLGVDGVPVTTDTLFLAGPVATTWTATMVMQLVDMGRLELDVPVNAYLMPELRLADEAVADSVTARQLLSHTGGFYGDAEPPPFSGRDALERTVAGFDELQQMHRPGSMHSYCPAGYVVLGRLIECLTGTTWAQALGDRLIEPLGLRRTFTQPEQAMVHRLAVGHLRRPGRTDLVPVDEWLLPQSAGPAGGTMATSVADLLAFAQLHLRDGRGPDGRYLLSPASARVMREPQTAVADPDSGATWGLGWEIIRSAGPLVMRSRGAVNGQESQLVLVPDLQIALCVLTVGDPGYDVATTMISEVIEQLTGVADTLAPRIGAAQFGAGTIEPADAVGTFGGADMEITVELTSDGRLHGTYRPGFSKRASSPPFQAPLTPAGGTTFRFASPREPHGSPWLTFLREGGGEGPATHVVRGGRAVPRR
ncbi:serine hydrolase domain-containing protein [Pseudonocardia sp. TRM90224]|uniref:serine hydrolase domain-containing protein n=1 Tax=Pseudonocardia sp. TRM90224 TaxID=2812678 RepID=UPI001E60AF32|nr:serine hydrolase domain-containing protein [Pseudonocardia sp. TRM90224]